MYIGALDMLTEDDSYESTLNTVFGGDMGLFCGDRGSFVTLVDTCRCFGNVDGE